MLVYEKITLVPSRPTLSYGKVSFSGGYSTQDVKRSQLRKLFHKKGRRAESTNDADHIFDAAEANCNFFLTVDRKSVLNVYESKRDEVKSLIGKMGIVDPPTLWDQLTKLRKA